MFQNLPEEMLGFFSPGSDDLNINRSLVEQLENSLKEDKPAALLLTVSTILHEFTHYGDDQDGVQSVGEEGVNAEIAIYGLDIDNISQAKTVIFLKSANESGKLVIPSKPPRMQKLGDIVFDSDKARQGNGNLIVKDIKTGKDYGVNRNEDGSYRYDGGGK